MWRLVYGCSGHTRASSKILMPAFASTLRRADNKLQRTMK
jgi:hypothetical protein